MTKKELLKEIIENSQRSDFNWEVTGLTNALVDHKLDTGYLITFDKED